MLGCLHIALPELPNVIIGRFMCRLVVSMSEPQYSVPVYCKCHFLQAKKSIAFPALTLLHTLSA